MSKDEIKEISTQVTGAWLEGHDPGERKFVKIGFPYLKMARPCRI